LHEPCLVQVQGRCGVPLLPPRTRPSISLVQRDLAWGGEPFSSAVAAELVSKEKYACTKHAGRGEAAWAQGHWRGKHAGYERQGGQCDSLRSYNSSADGGVMIEPSLRGLPFICCTERTPIPCRRGPASQDAIDPTIPTFECNTMRTRNSRAWEEEPGVPYQCRTSGVPFGTSRTGTCFIACCFRCLLDMHAHSIVSRALGGTMPVQALSQTRNVPQDSASMLRIMLCDTIATATLIDTHVTEGPVRHKERDWEAPPTPTADAVQKAIAHHSKWAAGAGVGHAACLSTCLIREQKYGGHA
jgi:hypothetical protein